MTDPPQKKKISFNAYAEGNKTTTDVPEPMELNLQTTTEPMIVEVPQRQKTKHGDIRSHFEVSTSREVDKAVTALKDKHLKKLLNNPHDSL